MYKSMLKIGVFILFFLGAQLKTSAQKTISNTGFHGPCTRRRRPFQFAFIEQLQSEIVLHVCRGNNEDFIGNTGLFHGKAHFLGNADCGAGLAGPETVIEEDTAIRRVFRQEILYKQLVW